MLGVKDGSVFARFGDEERPPITSEVRLFDTRGLGGGFSIPAAGSRAGFCPREMDFMLLMICLALMTKGGTEGILPKSRYA